METKSDIETRDIGGKVRNLRLGRVWTQEDLAREADVGIATIVRIERGQVFPHQQTIRRIAGALDVPPEDLVR